MYRVWVTDRSLKYRLVATTIPTINPSKQLDKIWRESFEDLLDVVDSECFFISVNVKRIYDSKKIVYRDKAWKTDKRRTTWKLVGMEERQKVIRSSWGLNLLRGVKRGAASLSLGNEIVI